MKKFQVIQITSPCINPGLGDVDYTAMLSKHLQSLGADVCYLKTPTHGDIKSSELAKEIHRLKPADGTKQIVHIQLRPPNGGTVFSPSQLDQFDHVVITLHEFTSLRNESRSWQAIEYLKHADHVIFTTPHEQQAVGHYLPDIFKKSTVIPVFNSLSAAKQYPHEIKRPNHIISFGSIRSGKGYSEILDLAKLIKDDPELVAMREKDPAKYTLKILIAGSCVNPFEVRRLVQKTYDLRDDEMPKTFNKRPKDMEAILKKFDELRAEKRKEVLPIELHFNVKEAELPTLFERANFAYLPLVRGASQHSTAIPTVMANGCIAITTQGNFTPKDLRGGAVIFADTPEAALDVIKHRIQHPELDIETRKKAQTYIDGISPQSAAQKHLKIYDTVVKQHKSKLIHSELAWTARSSSDDRSSSLVV